MPKPDVWRSDRRTEIDRITLFPSVSFWMVLVFSFLLVFLITDRSAYGDSKHKVILSDYQSDISENETVSPESETDVLQTRFSRKKKNRTEDKKEEINYSDYVKVLSKGTSKRSAKKQGFASLPLSQLTQEKQIKANSVLRKVSMYRELPTISLETNHDVYQYFLKNPEIAVAIWRVMGISKFKMWQDDSETYGADAGDGSKGEIDILYRSPTECMIVCNGIYDSPLLVKPIAAKALMYLQSEYQYDRNQNQIVTHKMQLFVSFPSQTVGTAARIISPVSNMIIDKNFHEVSLFLHMMTRSMSEHPQWVEHLAGKLDGVLDIRKQQLLQLTSKVYQENKKLKISQASGVSTKSSRLVRRK